MKVIEPGHIYELDHIDGQGKNVITFVNREDNPHEGTQTQEVLRMTIDIMSVLIDRTNHCDNCLRWEGNDRIIKALSESQRQMRLALLIHEHRALERKMDKENYKPEETPVGKDGHFIYSNEVKDGGVGFFYSYCGNCCGDGYIQGKRCLTCNGSGKIKL